MKTFLLVLASVWACGAARQYYHGAVGVPLAERIRAAEAAGQRVAGGVPANPEDFPYFAGLLIALSNGYTSVCGATLLSNTRMLTAAHCWSDGQMQGTSMTAVLASPLLFSGGVRVQSESVEMHQSYNSNNLSNDIAIVIIPFVAYENNRIQPVTLPSGFLLYLTYEGNQAMIIGYGVTNDNENITVNQSLRRAQAMVVNNLDCQTAYGFVVTESNICTSGLGRVGPCGGDSGGPLVTRFSGLDMLIGVTSFYAAGGCDIGFPGGFVRITSFASWIAARM